MAVEVAVAVEVVARVVHAVGAPAAQPRHPRCAALRKLPSFTTQRNVSIDLKSSIWTPLAYR